MEFSTLEISSIDRQGIYLHNLRMEIRYYNRSSQIFQIPIVSKRKEKYTSLRQLADDLIELGLIDSEHAQTIHYGGSIFCLDTNPPVLVFGLARIILNEDISEEIIYDNVIGGF